MVFQKHKHANSSVMVIICLVICVIMLYMVQNVLQVKASNSYEIKSYSEDIVDASYYDVVASAFMTKLQDMVSADYTYIECDAAGHSTPTDSESLYLFRTRNENTFKTSFANPVLSFAKSLDSKYNNSKYETVYVSGGYPINVNVKETDFANTTLRFYIPNSNNHYVEISGIEKTTNVVSTIQENISSDSENPIYVTRTEYKITLNLDNVKIKINQN